MKYLVGIVGYKGAGKTTVAEILRRCFGFSRFPLSAPMKDAVAEIFGWGPERFTPEGKERVDARWGISPRRALQTLGTEWGQFELGKDPLFAMTTGRCLWVRRLFDRVEEAGAERVVIDDVRFRHEAEEIHSRGGLLIRIERPGCSVGSHASEQIDDNVAQSDAGIVNDGSLVELEARALIVVGGLFGLSRIA